MTWSEGAFVSDEHDAEEMAATHMRQLGFPDAKRMPVGPDGGVDVTASGAIAQVKFRAQITGRPELQRLFGARGLDQTKALIFYSSARYSPAAVQYADLVEVALFTYDVHGHTNAVNAVATKLEEAGAAARAEPDRKWWHAPPESEPQKPPGWWARNWISFGFYFCWVSVPLILLMILTDSEETRTSGTEPLTWEDFFAFLGMAVFFTLLRAAQKWWRRRDREGPNEYEEMLRPKNSESE